MKKVHSCLGIKMKSDDFEFIDRWAADHHHQIFAQDNGIDTRTFENPLINVSLCNELVVLLNKV